MGKKKAEGDDDDEEVEKKKKEKEKKKKAEDDSDEAPAQTNGKGADSDSDVEELQYDSDEIEDVIETLATYWSEQNGAPSVADFFEELRMQQLAKVFNNNVRLYVTI